MSKGFGVKVDQKAVADLKKSFLKFGKAGVVAIGAAIEDATLGTHERAVKAAPVDNAALKQSLHFEVKKGELTGQVYSDKIYAPFVELGTRPHFPPVEALKEWAKRHGMEGAEWAIAKKIGEKGTKPQPFLYPAFETEGKLLPDYAKKHIDKAIGDAG